MNIFNKNKITISSLLILGLLIMPFSNFVPKANAQVNNTFSAGSGAIAGYGSSGTLAGAMAGLAPTIIQLPGCKAAIGNGIKTLFHGNISEFTTSQETPILDSFLESYSNEVDSVKVDSPTLNKKIEAQSKDIKDIKKSTSSTDKNVTCLNAIGKAIIKKLIQRMTLSIVNWIQNGNEGNPFYIENVNKYFGDLAKTEILGFGLEINNSSKYPFGKAFMQSVANGFNNTFATNAQYSLDKMIAETNTDCRDKNGNKTNCDLAFKADFSQGGWGAWEAMTQVPANNPLGFQLMASNELGKRLEGTSVSAAESVKAALDWGNGILGEERCTDPWGITKEQNDRYLKGEKTYTDSTNGHVMIATKCNKWEYVTPGSVVGHMLTKGIDDNNNSLLSAETINDAVAAIIDAATQRLSKEITGGLGLAGATTDETNYNQINGNYNSFSSQTALDFPAYQISASNWLQQNPNFNIRTDLNQALIDEQKTYVDKLNVLNSTFIHPDSNISVNGKPGYNGLLPTIYQLDYCIPGPHPGWQDDSYNILNTSLETVKPENEVIQMSVDGILAAVKLTSGLVGLAAGATVTAAVTGVSFGAAIGLGAAAGSVIPVWGTAIGAVVGITVATAINWAASKPSKNKKERMYYGGLAGALTGLHIDTDRKIDSDSEATQKNGAETQNIMTKASFIGEMNNIFDGYVKTINNIYKLSVLPDVTAEAWSEYDKAKGYQKLMEENKQKIVTQNGIIKRLEEIKEKVDELKVQLDLGNLNQAEYNTALETYIGSFGRLSSSLVSGDNIAEIDNLIDEALDEQDYVYNDLLKGPNGCEKQLEQGKNSLGNSIPWQIYDTKRMPYPAPILYDYNKLLGGNNPIPDLPGYPVYGNKTNSIATNTKGPGFLSYVAFIQDNIDDVAGTYRYCPLSSCTNFDYRLITNFPLSSWTIFLGIFDSSSQYNGVFENTIGIY